MVKIQRELHNAIKDKAINEHSLQNALEELKNASSQDEDRALISTAQGNVESLETANEKLKSTIGNLILKYT